YPFDHLVGRFAEALAIIHALLREGHADFTGAYYQVRACELRPRGPQARRLPIMIGATGSRMLGLTARYADLWNGQGGLATGGWEGRQAALDAACAALGRDPATLARTAIMQVDLPGAGPRLAGMGPARVAGSPEELARVFRGYAARGVTHLQVWL